MHFGIASAAPHPRFGLARTSHAPAQDVLPLPLLHFPQSLGADHSPVGNDTNGADPEPRLQPLHDRDQTLHIARVPRPEFATDRIAVLIQHHAHHHLLQVGTMIFRVPTLPQGLPPFSLPVTTST